MKLLFVLNDPPYGTERCYNALRLAHALVKKDPAVEVVVFLMADAVVAARKGQKTPEGYYNMERMLKRMTAGQSAVLLCGTCMDARGMTTQDAMDGARRNTMDELAECEHDFPAAAVSAAQTSSNSSPRPTLALPCARSGSASILTPATGDSKPGVHVLGALQRATSRLGASGPRSVCGSRRRLLHEADEQQEADSKGPARAAVSGHRLTSAWGQEPTSIVRRGSSCRRHGRSFGRLQWHAM